MKNLPILALVLCTAILLSACGQKPEGPETAGSDASHFSANGPAGVPVCPELTASRDAKGTPHAGSITLLSGQSPAALLNFYSSALAANGWVLGTSAEQGGNHHLLFRQGHRFLRIQIGPDKKGSTLQMIWGQMDGGQSIRESTEPDYEEEPEEDDGGGRGW